MPGWSARILRAARRPSSVWVGGMRTSIDRDVGLVGADLAQQVLGVAGLAGDVEARVLEQAHEPLAQQDGVLGDDDFEWVSASYGDLRSESSPRPGRGVEFERPVERGDTVGEAAQAGAAAGSAPPTPSSATSIAAWPLTRRDG